MLKILKYSDRYIRLKPYKTKDERDIILYTSDKYDFDEVLKMLDKYIESNIPLSEMSYTEKFNILLQLKNISVGETFSLICNCNECNKKYEEDSYFIDTIENTGIIPDFNDIVFKKEYHENINDYVDFDMDELDVNDYDIIQEHIDKYRTKFNFKFKTTCPFCNNESTLELTEKTLIENLSDDTIGNFYKVISSMVYFGNYTLTDINEMYPFERSIYLGLLDAQKKEQPSTQL